MFMSSSRFDPENDVHGTFGWREPGDVAPPSRPVVAQRALTVTQQARRAARMSSEAQQSQLGTGAELANTPPEQLAHNVEMIRRIRAGEDIGHVVMQQELPFDQQ
jgi:hypothetical protein